MNESIRYIIEFLLYGNQKAAAQVGYTANPEEWNRYKVVVIPCGHAWDVEGHFTKNIAFPTLTNPTIEIVDINQDHKVKIIRGADIIYNTFFFISRAEEVVNPHRDPYGRFLASHSLLGRNNRLTIPLVDEYARFLLKALDFPLPSEGYNHICLTHDIDSIALYRHLRGALGGIYRGKKEKVWASLRNIHSDPIYTFPWFVEQDARIPQAEIIYFAKDTRGRGIDYPQYNLHGNDFKELTNLLKTNNAHLGWHSSAIGDKAHRQTERIDYSLHRSHYLACSIEQMQSFADQGVRNDYTMGFADSVGFRLQTTRPVRWINPLTGELTPLTLHPLVIMDCSLSNAQYMNLDEDEAYFLCEELFTRIRRHHGELVLLFHNNSLTDDTYHRNLYVNLLTEIQRTL